MKRKKTDERSTERTEETTMGSDVEMTEKKNKSEKVKSQTETDLKTAISQLRECEEATEDKITQLKNCSTSIKQIDKQIEEETDVDAREDLKREKKGLMENEVHIQSGLNAEKELLRQSKVTVTALNKKLYEIEKAMEAIIDKEMMNITAQKKARDERRKKDNDQKTLKTSNPDERGASGYTLGEREGEKAGSQHRIDVNSLPSTLWDDFCSMTLEKIYPGQSERIRSKYSPEEVVKSRKSNPFDLRDEDLPQIQKKASSENRGRSETTANRQKNALRSSTPRDHYLSESDDTDDFWKRDRSTTPKRAVRTREPHIDDTDERRRGRKGRKEDKTNERESSREDEPTFREFAKLMGDNLIALRKIQERPPRWGGHRMRTYKGDPKENFDDFAEEILYSCKKLEFDSDEEEKVRYLKGFLEGEAAEFLASMPHKSKYSLKEILKKIRDRFKDSRTQSDFLYMLTTKRHNPKNETIREYSHALHNLVIRAYPNMPDEQRMQILKQKFLSSINAEDLEKSVISDKLAKATYQEVVDLVSKVEEFRKTKERCKPRAEEDWFVNPMLEDAGSGQRSYPNSRNAGRYSRDRQGYRPRTYPEDRECHYCGEVGHLQYRCQKRLEDKQMGNEHSIIQKNAKKICTNCGRNNHTVEECRRPRDYKQGTAYDGIPYPMAPKNQNPRNRNGHESGKQTSPGNSQGYVNAQGN